VPVTVGVVLSLWASAFIGIRSAGHSFAPGALALIRLVIGSLVLAVPTLRSRQALPRGRALGLVALYGLAWFGAYNVALNTAERHLDAGTSAMLVNVAPLLVALGAGALLGEGFPRRLLAGLVVAFAGVAIIALGSAGRHGDNLGIVLALLAATCYATGVLSQKLALRSVPVLQATWLGCAVGTLATLAFAPEAATQLAHARPEDILVAVYLGAGPTATGFALWAYALRHTSAGSLASTTLAVPAIAVGLSWAVLGQLPTVVAVVGGVVCLIGVGVAVARSPMAARQARSPG
jgi:drug/metabolite transporter (DMT)-like permease